MFTYPNTLQGGYMSSMLSPKRSAAVAPAGMWRFARLTGRAKKAVRLSYPYFRLYVQHAVLAAPLSMDLFVTVCLQEGGASRN
jgi:hypothetical protein